MANDGRCRPAGAVNPTVTGSGQTLDEFYFANRAQLFRAAGTVHGPGLDERGGPYVMSAVDIGIQFMEKVPLIGNALWPEVPEVMMGVAYREFRLQSWFLG